MPVIMTPRYNTMLFCDVWDEYDKFKDDIELTPFSSAITTDNLKIVFYLLYAKYGNNPISNNDVNQFKAKVFSIIFQYGPTWQKRIEIQNKLRALTDDELMAGSKNIYNHAYNPSSTPSTSVLDELDFINDQNTSNVKRGKLEAYQGLMALLEIDVTDEFIMRFAKLFKKFVSNERPLLYITEDEEDEGNDN